MARSAFEEDAAGGGLGRRHAEVPARERFDFGRVDLAFDTGFDLGQSLAGDAESGEVFLKESDRIALPPLGEPLGREGRPGFAFVVGGVSAHAKRLGDEQHRSAAFATRVGRELRGGVGVEHVVAVEHGAFDAERAWPVGEVAAVVLTELAHATLREITLRQALTRLAEANRLLAEEMHKVGVLNERLSELAHTDALTGLYNRRAYDQHLAREWRRVQRNGAPLSVLLVDADHFKAVNDQHGHAMGDQVLQVLASVLQEGARDIDVAARVGGEEFAVLLADTDATSAAGVAERIRSQIAQAEAMPVAAVTVSIGVATLQAQEQPDSLQHRADQALYMAKSQGRNRVVSAP